MTSGNAGEFSFSRNQRFLLGDLSGVERIRQEDFSRVRVLPYAVEPRGTRPSLILANGFAKMELCVACPDRLTGSILATGSPGVI